MEASHPNLFAINTGDKLILVTTCRRSETEADSIGMRLAAKACYDPAAAGMAFHLGSQFTCDDLVLI